MREGQGKVGGYEGGCEEGVRKRVRYDEIS